MIEIKLGDEIINVDPRLTISQYQKIRRNPERYKTSTEVLSLYLDLEPDELKGLPVDQIRFVESLLTQHYEQPNQNDITFVFEYNGVTYGLENDWGNMTWGQWTDLEIFSQKDKLEDNIHIIMALLYRPITIQNGKSYKLEPFNNKNVLERAEIFSNIPVNYWFGVSTFFLLMSTTFINDMQTSLKARMKLEKMIAPARKILPKWLLPKLPQDSTLNLLLNSSKEI
jgi:hypothetical protein